MVGIVSYGVYIPRYRIKVEEIAKIWGEDPESIKGGLGIYEKSVPDIDEDTVTISVECGREAMKRAVLNGSEIQAVFVGSESHPYAVKPTATIVGEALSIDRFFHSADLEFACKAGTAGIQNCIAMVESGMIRNGLAIGSDTSQGAPGDPLEYSAAAGGAAFVIGNEDVIVEIKDTLSFTTDTPDFWRREGQPYPSHGGRFTGEPAYFRHVSTASIEIMRRNNLEPEDFSYAVFHMPNGKFPVRVARNLGFSPKQIEQGLVVRYIGNTYSASSLIGFCAILDVAKPGDRILLTSFGSGAGSDAFIIEVTENIESYDRNQSVWKKIEKKEYIDYGMYAKLRRKIRMG